MITLQESNIFSQLSERQAAGAVSSGVASSPTLVFNLNYDAPSRPPSPVGVIVDEVMIEVMAEVGNQINV